MNIFRNSFFLIMIVWIGSFVACNDGAENFSTSPGDVLSFSHDTLTFDTVFSQIGSTTKRIMVYNHNSKPLRITSIDLASGGQTGFRLNVDGMRGNHFEQVEIQAKDSLYIFVEVTVDPNNVDNPVLIEDSVVFLTNSVKQQVLLEAYGQDAYIWKGKILEESTILTGNKPYLIYDSLFVKEGATLQIDPGSRIYMHNLAEIIVSGSLKINGTLDKPVTIRGDRLDNMFTDIPYDRFSGQWGGIYFSKTSYNNEINYAHIRNGIYGLYFEESEPQQSKLIIKNTVLTNTDRTLFSAINCHIEGENCEFSNSGGALISLNGGKYKFVQCTLANYFPWAVRSTRSLTLYNGKKDENNQVVVFPLVQADFLNCIIYGAGSVRSEIGLYPLNSSTYPEATFDYRIDYSLIKVQQDSINTNLVTNCILNKDPVFMKIDNRLFVYDFRLDSVSPGINVADPVIASQSPYDMNNINRFSDGGPDMGAYEWISGR